MTGAVDEPTARAITAMRAIETSDRERVLWSEDERVAASRDAARAVGASASAERFLSERAALMLSRLAARHPALARVVNALAWRHWIAPAVLAAAFIAGLAADRIGAGGRINILAPPVLGLLVWNLAVYVALLIRAARAWRRHRGAGFLGRAIATLSLQPPRVSASLRAVPLATAAGAFTAAWSERAGPLYAARAARILHVGAALFAAGVVAGMYVRGLAFEYRASWESTFLDPDTVHALLALVLAPGAWLTALGVPDTAHIASIRRGSDPGSENAALWLHLYAATVLIVVIVPRLVLALIDLVLERRRARFAVPLGEPYFRRLLRGFVEAPYRVHVVPYSFSLPPGAEDALRAVLARAFGALCEVSVAAPLTYGGEDALPDGMVPADTTLVIALFSAAATPEPAAHGAFVTTLRSGGSEVVALIDESALQTRWPADVVRFEQRRSAWRDVLDPCHVGVVFVALAAPDLVAAEADLQRAAERAAA